MKKEWYQNVYRRNVIDMHIPDWDGRFLSEFDITKYVEMLTLADVDSAVVCAQSHTGICHYPTKSGHMHNCLKGRDIFGEVVEVCHHKGIKVVAYYSLIFNSWAYDNYSEWRIINSEGRGAAENSRYGVCCPNSSGYRDFVITQVEELCNNYQFEGIRFDMTFWPCVCYCPSCRKRYATEVGRELPTIVNWEDPIWVGFQRKREEWLIDFAVLVTNTVRRLKPDVSVEHQASTYTASWKFGVTEGLSKYNDFLQGDFYGGSLEGSFVCKLLYNLTENRPFGFETSCHLSLSDHTTMKSKELLKAKVFSSLANGGAFIFIDAIDPVGTLNHNVYKKMGEIFRETKPFQKYIGGELCQDVAIYLSTRSKCNFADNGKNVKDASDKMPHLNAALGVAKSFIANHIPFGIITKKNIKDLGKYKVIVLPNILMMDEDEAGVFKDYVRKGGSLYASKYTSLIRTDGKKLEDFLLADIFGISYRGETKEDFTYIAPTDEGENIFRDYSLKYPLSIYGTHIKTEAKSGVKILGTMVLPYTDPKDSTRYASIHSNPPGITTEYPAVIMNIFGKGKVIYVASDLETKEADQNIFIDLIRILSSEPFIFEADAPESVEITAFHQKRERRYIVNLLNFQSELPNIPVEGIVIRMNIGDNTVKRVTHLPERKDKKFRMIDDCIEFRVPRLETFQMFAVEYK